MVSDTKRDIEILNESLGGEYFGIAAYEAAMGTDLLEEGVRFVAPRATHPLLRLAMLRSRDRLVHRPAVISRSPSGNLRRLLESEA